MYPQAVEALLLAVAWMLAAAIPAKRVAGTGHIVPKAALMLYARHLHTLSVANTFPRFQTYDESDDDVCRMQVVAQ